MPIYDFVCTKSIFTVYQEYFEGIESTISVESLETIFGASWRRGKGGLGEELRRRKRIANWVQGLVTSKGRAGARLYTETKLTGISPRKFHDNYLASGKPGFPYDLP